MKMVTRITILLVMVLVIAALLILSRGDEFSPGEGATWNFGMASSSDTPTMEPSEPELTHLPSNLEDLPIIVWWTKNLYPHINRWTTTSCPNSRCYATNKQKFAKHPQTTAFYFYGTEFEPKALPLPRLQRHIWALAHEESPLNNFALDHAVAMNLFNYTGTYHRASDFPITTVSLPGVEFIVNRQPVSTKLKNEYQKSKGLAPLIYVQSHCEVPSDRDRYVEELMQYIKVDSYGNCVHNKDLPLELINPVENMFDGRFKDLIAQYKFVISFENAFCDDYMTEKLFRPLHVGSVPVYRGSRLARDFMPDNHSIIMTDDFESPKELAEFLHRLNENDEEYDKYLEFKKRGTITNRNLQEHLDRRPWRFTNDDKDYGPFFEGFECYVCDKAMELYENEKVRAADPSIPMIKPKITDGRKFACPAPEPFEKPKKLDWWFIYDYVGQYWSGLDSARAMRDMLKANESDPKKFHQYLAKYVK